MNVEPYISPVFLLCPYCGREFNVAPDTVTHAAPLDETPYIECGSLRPATEVMQHLITDHTA